MAKTYDTYKDSEVAWIGEIPSGWKIVRQKNIFSLTKQLVKESWKTTQLLSLTTKGIKCIDIGTTSGKVPDSYNTYQIVSPNNLVMCLFDLDCSAVFSGLSKVYGMISPAYKVLKVNEEYDPQYYTYWFDYIFDGRKFMYLSKNIRYSLTYDEFASLNIPNPSYAEQQAIASFLDKKCGEVDSLIALQDEMIGELQAYKYSVITEAVTKGLEPNVKMKDSGVEWIGEIPEKWEIKLLSKIIWLRARLGWKGLKAEEYVEFGYPFLSAFNIVNNRLDWSELNYINQQRFDESPEIKLSIGDVLIVKDGAGIGKIARIDSLPNGESTVNSSLGVITPSKILNYKYLYYFLLSNPFQNMVGFLKNGMGVPHLTQENMKSVLIPIPSIEKQVSIVSYLDKKCEDIDSLISLKLQKIAELKDYKKNIIYEYVTGKKRV